MVKYLIPKREFTEGERKVISIRVPNELKMILEEISSDKGRTLTDLILTVLDQYAQQELIKKRSIKS